MTSESQCTNSNLSRTMRLRSGNALFSKFPTLRPSNPFRSTNVGSLEHEDSLDQWTCPYCFKIIPASRSPIIDPEHCSCVEGGGMGSQSFDSQSNIPALVLNKVPCETRPRLGKEEVDRLETCFRTNPKPTTQKKRQFAEDMGVDLARINNWFQNRRAKRRQEQKQKAYEATQGQERLETLDRSSPDFYFHDNGLSGGQFSNPHSFSISSLMTGPPPVASYNPQYVNLSSTSMESLQKTLTAAVHVVECPWLGLDIYGNKSAAGDIYFNVDEMSPSRAHWSSKVSTSDLISVEDETDWDGYESLESAVQKMRLDMDPVEEQGGQDPLVNQRLTTAQRSLVHRLMEEFWVIYTDLWQSENRQHGSTESGSPSGSSGLTLGGIGSPKPGSSKRLRPSGDEDSENEQNRPSKKKGKEPIRSDSSETPQKFACPFRKRNPRKYCVQTWRTCALTPHTTVARVKAHLYAYHTIHQCQRCKELFNSEAELDVHIEAPSPCPLRLAEPVDGITSRIRTKLQSRKKAHPRQTEAERWKQIYEILFRPLIDEPIPSPSHSLVYFEPIRDGDVEADDTSQHRDIANYEAYLRRELPRTFNAVLQRAVSMEINPIEERLREQLQTMIQEAQNQTFANWRTLRNSESGDTMPQEGVDPVSLVTPPLQSDTNLSTDSADFEKSAADTCQTTPDLEPQHALAHSNSAEYRPTVVGDGPSLKGTSQEHLDDLELLNIDWAINLDNLDMEFPQDMSAG